MLKTVKKYFLITYYQIVLKKLKILKHNRISELILY